MESRVSFISLFVRDVGARWRFYIYGLGSTGLADQSSSKSACNNIPTKVNKEKVTNLGADPTLQLMRVFLEKT